MKTIVEDNKFIFSNTKIQITYEDYSYSSALDLMLPKEVTTPGGFEVIGSIAHLNLRQDQFPYKYLIGKVILDKAGKVTTVVNKLEKLNNIYRTPILELIGGK